MTRGVESRNLHAILNSSYNGYNNKFPSISDVISPIYSPDSSVATDLDCMDFPDMRGGTTNNDVFDWILSEESETDQKYKIGRKKRMTPESVKAFRERKILSRYLRAWRRYFIGFSPCCLRYYIETYAIRKAIECKQ